MNKYIVGIFSLFILFTFLGCKQDESVILDITNSCSVSITAQVPQRVEIKQITICDKQGKTIGSEQNFGRYRVPHYGSMKVDWVYTAGNGSEQKHIDCTYTITIGMAEALYYKIVETTCVSTTPY